MDIIEHIAYITLADGRKVQVLVYDENGVPADWDAAATAALAAEISKD